MIVYINIYLYIYELVKSIFMYAYVCVRMCLWTCTILVCGYKTAIHSVNI